MSLEEHTNEEAGDRCEECGAKLTSSELQAALESGCPTLCGVHADDVVSLGEEDDRFGG